MKNTVVRLCKTGARRIAGSACLIAASLLIAACGSNPDHERPLNPFKPQVGQDNLKEVLSDRELHLKADELYRRAHAAVLASDWGVAKPRLDKLISQYPFSEYATQAEMEEIYIEYKQAHSDEAVAAVDRFLRAHPRSPQAAYVQYLRGLANFSRDEGFLDALGVSPSARKDVSGAQRAFEDFALLIQRYPDSKYCGDARRRMIYLRDRVADHDLSVARYYQRRGAYIAAAKRAQSVIAEYPGAPAAAEAMILLERSYRSAGLTQQADDAAAIISRNKFSDKKAEVTVPPAVADRTTDDQAVPPTEIAGDAATLAR